MYLSQQSGTEIMIEKVRVGLNSVRLKGVYAEDHRGEVMVDAHTINIGIKYWNLSKKSFSLGEVKLDSTYLNLTRYAGDDRINLAHVIDFFEGSQGDSSGSIHIPLSLKCNSIILNDFHFRLLDEEKKRSTESIDYADMDISDIDLIIKNFSLLDDSINADIVNLSAREKSGFHLKSFKGVCIVTPRGFSVRDMDLMTNNSRIFMDVVFDYTEFPAFKDFIAKVRMTADIRSSRVNLSDIGYFAEALKIMDEEIKIEGSFDGYVEDYSLEEFKFSHGKATKFYGDIWMKGLPDIKKMRSGLDIQYLFSNKHDLESFALPIEGTFIEMPEQLVSLGDFKLTGKFEGRYNDFQADAYLRTDIGELKSDLIVRVNRETKKVMYEGNLDAMSFDLGTFLEISELGNLSMSFEIQGSGINMDDLDLYAAGWIDTIRYSGIDYHQIVIGGDLKQRQFNGRIFLDDDLIKMEFNGLIDFNKAKPELDFTAIVRNAMLSRMNLIERPLDAYLATRADINLEIASLDNWSGVIAFDSTIYFEDGQEYIIDSLKISGGLFPEKDDFIIAECDYFDASVMGEYALTSLYPSFSQLILSIVYDSIGLLENIPQSTRYEFQFKSKNTEDLTNLFVPSLIVPDGSQIMAEVDVEKMELEIEATSPFTQYIGMDILNWRFNASKNENSNALNFSFNSDKLKFRDADPGRDIPELGMDSIIIAGTLQDTRLSWDINWDKKEILEANYGQIAGFYDFITFKEFEFGISHMNVLVNGEKWTMNPENSILLDDQSISVENVHIYSDNQDLKVSGRATDKASDTIHMQFRDWDLQNFAPLITLPMINLDGVLSGRLDIAGIYSTPTVLSDLRIIDVTLNEIYLGEFEASSGWIPGDSSFRFSARIMEQGNLSEYETLDLAGNYYPFRKNDHLKFDFSLSNLNVKVAEPFLEGILSDLNGYLSGDLKLNGSVEKPVLSGAVKLMRTEFLVDYTNVKYSLTQDIYFDENIIFFENAPAYDELGNAINTSLKFTHKYFKDWTMQLDLEPDQALGLNTNQYMNDIFYGTAYASGAVNIYGPLNNLSMDIQVSPDRGTVVTIPISQTVDVSQSDFIIFKGQEDTGLSSLADYMVEVEGLDLNLGLDMNPNADIQIFLPGNLGSIKANGRGQINMGIDSRGYLGMSGDYIISRGNFKFTFEQLLSKRFELVSGSSIRWIKNIYDARARISALYRLKTTLSGLGLSLPQGSENQRVTVNLYIHLSENLFDPNIRFRIEFPYLEETVKSNVYAVLDTTDNAMMNQQALSLLVLNSFSAPGYATSTSPINSYSIIANQLSAMLSKISNDFDIGVNYIPGDDVSREEVEVALSTQLFDNRLIIDGNIDVPTSNESSSSQSSSDIVGEVNIEYKLTPDGRFRVRAFNRANNLNALEEYAPYTQGIGFFYRKEFDNLGELIVRKKKKRSEGKSGE